MRHIGNFYIITNIKNAKLLLVFIYIYAYYYFIILFTEPITNQPHNIYDCWWKFKPAFLNENNTIINNNNTSSCNKSNNNNKNSEITEDDDTHCCSLILIKKKIILEITHHQHLSANLKKSAN